MNAWRTVPNFPLYEINRGGVVKNTLNGQTVQLSRSNGTGDRYHLEHKSGRVVSMKKIELMQWAFPKETE